MILEEWALILFTLLAQMSVGSFWVLGAVHYYANRKAGEEEADRMADRALLAVGPLLLLALLASLLHLGDPLNAFRAVANISSSWLSREILSVVLFAIVGGLFAIFQWRKIGSSGLRMVLAVLAAIIGFFLILSMSMVYMLPTQPSWDTVATPIAFFSTTLLLGSLAMGVAFTANYLYTIRKEEEGQEVQLQLLRGSLRGIAVTSLLMLAIQLVVAPLYIATLSTGDQAAQQSASMLTDEYSTVFILRLILSVVGAGLFTLLLYQGASGETKVGTLANLAYVAFAIVLVAEVMGRYLFYAIQVPIGI
jgi:anaerobic dimethyl sulfoxide reductase subunit C (anchor subunit)